MSIVLSLIVAAVFGTGDFCGGLATKRLPAVQVVAGSHLIGLVGVVVAAVMIDNTFTWDSLLLGMVAGAFGATAVALLYRGLSTGPMSVIAPVTAVTSAAVPATFGVVSGERFSSWGWLGVALAFVAIALTASSDDKTGARISFRVVGEALLAGVGFGIFFIFLDLTDAEAAPWPVVGARLFSSTVLVAWLLAKRRPIIPRTAVSFRLVALTGIFDTGSNVLFLYALQVGDLTTVSVLSSLYPIATIILARFVLDERMTRTQLVGTGIALAATVLIAAG